MFNNIKIRKGHIALLVKNDEYQQILPAGEYRFRDWRRQLKVATFELNQPLDNTLADYLQQHHPQWVSEFCQTVAVPETCVGLHYKNDLLVELLPPGTRRLWWLNGSEQRVDLLPTDDVAIPTSIVASLMQPQLRQHVVAGHAGVLLALVPAWHVGILKVDGMAQALLPPGTRGYWRFNHQVEVDVVDTRMQALEVSGQEILTRDKVSLRINLAANWRYSDVMSAWGQLTKPLEYLYRELQFALREAVGTRSLDELLENKQVIDELVSTQIRQNVAAWGMEVISVGVKDIILPGEMKTILSRLVEAEKSAQANVIRRREETAATRSLLNTAKVMENNPVALRLKELETLERVAERIDKISVFGGLDQVLNGLVQIKGN